MTYPKNVKEMIGWLRDDLNRPPLPECPIQAATVGKEPKQPAYISGWRGVEPFVKSINWKQFQNNNPQDSMIGVWFKDPKTGIGTLAGFNGRHWLGWIDYDVKDFASQEECDRAVTEWMEQYPIVKECPRFRTPGGGYRFLIAWGKEPEDFGANNGFSLSPDGSTRAGELLTKNGGHTLLPPTIGINGKPYYWEYWQPYPPIVSSPEDVGIYPLVTQTGKPKPEQSEEKPSGEKAAPKVENDLIQFLKQEVYPRLSPEQIYNWPGHNWQERRNGKLQGYCPWHDSQSGTAFYVDEVDGTPLWRCPSCNFGGDPMTYRDRLNGGNGSPRGKAAVEIVKELARDAGMSPPEESKPQPTSIPKSVQEVDLARLEQAIAAIVKSQSPMSGYEDENVVIQEARKLGVEKWWLRRIYKALNKAGDEPWKPTLEELVEKAGQDTDEFWRWFKSLRRVKKQTRTKREEAEQGNSTTTETTQAERDTRPLIQLDPGKMNSILSGIERGLSKCESARDAIYVQGNHDGIYLSRVLKASPDGRSALLEISKEVDTLDLLTTESLQYELNRRFQFERYDARKEDYKPVDCPRTVAAQFLASGRWPHLARLTGISHIPLLCKNGIVISQPGYHQPTGMLLQFDSAEFPPIPEEVSREMAIAALDILKDWLKEFPFQMAQHRSAALSAVLTAACRKILKQAPLHAISATKAGTGKGTLAKGISILVLNGHAGTIPFTGDSEEFRKKITSFLKSGQPIGMIDNVTGVLGGDVLEMVLTEPSFKDRLLGGNQMPSFSTQVTLLANGNNLRFRPDMTRRTILCVLDSQLESPEHRMFERDFEEYTRANRGQLVMAAITVLKAYIDAGFPDKARPRLGSFEGWSDLVRSALVWLGEADPVETQKEIAAQDDERQTLLAFLQSWQDTFGNIPRTAKEVCLWAVQKGSGDLRDVLLEVALDRKGDIAPRRLSYYLRGHHRSVVNGLRFENAGNDRLGYAQWRVVTVTHDPPKQSSASSAQSTQTTAEQGSEPAEDQNSSSAPILGGESNVLNGKASDRPMQRMQNRSSAPSNNGKSMVSATSAEDAEDIFSRSDETVREQSYSLNTPEQLLAAGGIEEDWEDG